MATKRQAWTVSIHQTSTYREWNPTRSPSNLPIPSSKAHLPNPLQVPQEALLYVIVAPWPDFTLWKGRGVPAKAGLKLLASSPETVRAWPGGIGWAKLGANYGPSFQAHEKCQAQGYDQILWLFGNEGEVTEAGASNFFVIWKDRTTGRKELVTAAVEDQVILPGVVRRSVLDLVRERLSGGGFLEDLGVVERKFFIGEIVEAWRDGRLIEAFVSGTAVSLFPSVKMS